MMFSVNELKECLRRLKSLSLHGGDIFFAGISRTMVARPVVPQSWDFNQGLHREENLRDKDNKKAVTSFLKSAIIRTKNATGGGSGLAKGPESPTKA